MADAVRRVGRREIRVANLNEPISHYTDAVLAGDYLFISGVAGVDEQLHLVGDGDVAVQFRRAMESMEQILAAGGATFSDIVKVTVYLKQVNDRSLINPIRQEFFGDARPASTLIGVNEFAIEGMLVEIDAIAYVGDQAVSAD